MTDKTHSESCYKIHHECAITRLEALQRDFDLLKAEIDGKGGWRELWKGEQHLRVNLESRLGAAQARIDALMLEYCPDEMTDEQTDEWANHQYVAGDDRALEDQWRCAVCHCLESEPHKPPCAEAERGPIVERTSEHDAIVHHEDGSRTRAFLLADPAEERQCPHFAQSFGGEKCLDCGAELVVEKPLPCGDCGLLGGRHLPQCARASEEQLP